MHWVRPKKSLGQHFLRDLNIAQKIVGSLQHEGSCNILEIGPGKGVLSQFLNKLPGAKVKYIEIDREAVQYLQDNFSGQLDIIAADFLKTDVASLFGENYLIIGNFPYNISSQIFFKILDNKDLIDQVVCMIQKEVARRIAAPPGTKTYGILSVLLQAWYHIEYLFTVPAGVFDPPPKVESAVIRLRRNQVKEIGCNEKVFLRVIKTAFNQRRKTLRNSLRPLLPDGPLPDGLLQKRPEQLGVEEFVVLTRLIESRAIN